MCCFNISACIYQHFIHSNNFNDKDAPCFLFFRYVYRFVCDLHGLLGYTAQEIHAMVDLQPLSATAGTAATANVTNNNNENHVNHSNHSHDDNPGSLAPSETPSSLMGGHHSIKIEQIPKTPRHMYE